MEPGDDLVKPRILILDYFCVYKIENKAVISDRLLIEDIYRWIPHGYSTLLSDEDSSVALDNSIIKSSAEASRSLCVTKDSEATRGALGGTNSQLGSSHEKIDE
ncbi:hypothetical protein L1887_14181 [Cichorium endivia]|nr:hypothetical protein L1887_14181 [Cichorium endivia]